MNALLLLIMIGIATPTLNLHALSPSNQAQRPGSANPKKGDAKEEALDPRFNLTKPIPQELSSTEQELANFFSQEIIPIAQDLRNIVVGKEADAARQVATRRRDQKMAEAKRKGARFTGRGGSRRATISGRGAGRWSSSNTTWGRRPGWGGFRPSTSRFSRPSYRPSSYRPTSSFASQPSGSSSPSSSSGGIFRSSGSSSQPKNSRSSGFESGKTNDSSTKTPTRSGSYIDDKAKKINNLLLAAKDRTLSIMKDVTASAENTTDKEKVYKLALDQSEELVREFSKMQQLSDHEDLSTKAKSDFEKTMKKECEPGGTIGKFAPHCIRQITYPSMSDTILKNRQNLLQKEVFDVIAKKISTSELKKMVEAHDAERAKYYEDDIKTELATAEKDKSDKAASTGTPPFVKKLTPADETKLTKTIATLKDIEHLFKTQLFDPWSTTPKKNLFDPIKIEALKKRIEKALEP